MDPTTLAALISGGSQLAGGIAGGLFGSSGQSATNAQQMSMFQQQMMFAENQQNKAQQFNHDEAELSRGWQTHMSNSAYQRAMSDMRLAGLNPILAANLGGASTPGGASASITGASPPGSPSLGNPGESLARGSTSAGQAVATAAATKAILTTAKKDESQTDLNKSSEDFNKSNTNLNGVLQTKAQQETATSAQQAKESEERARNYAADTSNKGMQNVILMHDATSAYERSRIAKADADKATNIGTGIWSDLANTVGRLGRGTLDELKKTGTHWGEGGDPNNIKGSTFNRPRRQDPVTVFPNHSASGGLTIDMRK